MSPLETLTCGSSAGYTRSPFFLRDDRAKGGLLVFPQLDVAVDLRVGDMLAFDAELLHCNTAFRNRGFHRLSCVFYNHVP